MRTIFRVEVDVTRCGLGSDFVRLAGCVNSTSARFESDYRRDGHCTVVMVLEVVVLEVYGSSLELG